jgi:4'-phosphopantetheinyl transferase
VTEVYGVFMNRLLTTDEFQQMLRGVSEDRRAQAAKFRKPEDAHRALIGEMLTRAVIIEKLQVTNAEIVFAKNRYGKPCVVGYPSFHFNVSHSGRWIVCAVDQQPVGIDIEQIIPVDLEVAKPFFSEEEYRYLMEQEEQEQLGCFYEIWTMKESYVKWTGRGLSLPPNSFSILLQPATIHPFQMSGSSCPCFFRRWNVDREYRMAVCSTSGIFYEEMMLKRYEDLTFHHKN